MRTPDHMRATKEQDPILTTREAAGRLGVAVSTAQLWMESGAIPSWKTPGGHRRCRLSDVERLSNQAPPAAASPDAGLAEEFLPAVHATYPLLPHEAQRLMAVARSGLIGSAPETRYDRIAWLASQITQCPMALVSLLTSERQWFKAKVGLNVAQTPRDAAFCSHAILSEIGMVVEDAHADARFAGNPLVTGAPHIRFYAGIPVTDPDHNRLGTLCVLDTVPRKLSADQLRGLAELADMVSTEISRKD